MRGGDGIRPGSPLPLPKPGVGGSHSDRGLGDGSGTYEYVCREDGGPYNEGAAGGGESRQRLRSRHGACRSIRKRGYRGMRLRRSLPLAGSRGEDRAAYGPVGRGSVSLDRRHDRVYILFSEKSCPQQESR